MQFEAFSFGSIRFDGVTYEHDVVIDHSESRKRNKKPSKKFCNYFGHPRSRLRKRFPGNAGRW